MENWYDEYRTIYGKPFSEVPQEVIDGVTGLLCKMDVQDIADKMEWMIIHEKERKEMAVKAHQVAGRYKKAVVLKEWESAYMSVLSNRESL